MQATYNVRRSPLTILVFLAAMLAALIVGGVGGYLVKGLASPSVATTGAGIMPSAAVQPTIKPFTSVPSYVYEQGGRPQVVYDEAAGKAP